jgi:hypothetical protein
MNVFKGSAKQETECASQPTVEESYSPDFKTRKTTVYRLSDQANLPAGLGGSRPDSPTIDHSPRGVGKKVPKRFQAGKGAVATDGSSPV